MDIAFVLHALEAEMLGREWEVPAPLYKGPNVNLLQESLDTALNDSLSVGEPKSREALVTYKGVTPLTLWAALLFLYWHIWQHLWHGVRHKVIILPSKACTSLVGRTRKEADAAGLSDIRLSTGDILVAWLFKVRISIHFLALSHSSCLFRQHTLTELLPLRLSTVQTWRQPGPSSQKLSNTIPTIASSQFPIHPCR